MTVPISLVIVAIGLMVGSYMLFLWASWQQYQDAGKTRDNKIDELLSRLPKAAEAT